MSFSRLAEKIAAKGAPIVVGLDPRKNMKIFEQINKADLAKAYLDFNKQIIDQIADIVPAVKPQVAFYEALGVKGFETLSETCKYAREKGLYIIMDAKRNDIGSTNEAYAEAYLAKGSDFEADALTINVYLGSDGTYPFIDRAKETDKAIFALVKTSNKSSGDIQDLFAADGKRIYTHVADMLIKLAEEKNAHDNVGFVVGATHQEQLKELRDNYPKTFFLVPGYGAQGGTAEEVALAFGQNNGLAIVNSSRGIIENENPRLAAKIMRDDILKALQSKPII